MKGAAVEPARLMSHMILSFALLFPFLSPISLFLPHNPLSTLPRGNKTQTGVTENHPWKHAEEAGHHFLLVLSLLAIMV